MVPGVHTVHRLVLTPTITALEPHGALCPTINFLSTAAASDAAAAAAASDATAKRPRAERDGAGGEPNAPTEPTYNQSREPLLASSADAAQRHAARAVRFGGGSAIGATPVQRTVCAALNVRHTPPRQRWRSCSSREPRPRSRHLGAHWQWRERGRGSRDAHERQRQRRHHDTRADHATRPSSRACAPPLPGETSSRPITPPCPACTALVRDQIGGVGGGAL